MELIDKIWNLYEIQTIGQSTNFEHFWFQSRFKSTECWNKSEKSNHLMMF